jgi:hypothetical protein
MRTPLDGKITLILPLLAITFVIIGCTVFSNGVEAEITTITPGSTEQNLAVINTTERTGNYVVVHLDTNILKLKNGSNTLQTIHILSQGKPGSYYETIGGEYKNDYKKELHFSSIGLVYMPYSVHVFGNYFIHGVPYYPDGTDVASTYSGGCVRLENTDAETVYNFVTKGTPIIITRGTEDDFTPTNTSTITRGYPDMTRIMIAIISLESLTQDNEIVTREYGATTRKDLLSKLLARDYFDTRAIYENSVTEKDFVNAMNAKAKSLGLTSTLFTDTYNPVITTREDYARFMEYVRVYKSFLLQY